jgi:hypothetical protein
VEKTDETERRTRFGRFLILFMSVGLAFLLACNELADYDAWWHLKTGQLIPARGIPSTDWYSFSSVDRSWIDVHWGFQLLIANVYSIGGIAGLVVMQAVIVAGTIWVMHRAADRQSPTWFVWGMLLLATIAMSGRFNVRPEILSMLFLAMDLSILLSAGRRPSLLWLLVPIQIIWANVQSLYVLGPVLLAIFILEAILGGPARRVGWTRLLVVSLLVGASCLASPYGYKNVLFLFEVFQKIDPNAGQVYRDSIGELTPLPVLIADGGYRAGYIAATLGLAAISLMGVVIQARSILLGREIFRLLPIVAFAFLAWQSVRNVGHFAVVAGMLSMVNLGPRLPELRRWRLDWTEALPVTLVIGMAWVGGRWSTWIGSDREFGFGAHPEHFSFPAMEVCAKPGMPTRAAVFHLGHAATYIFACGPEKQVLMDPRLEVNSEQTYQQYREIQASLERGSPEGLAMLDALDVPLVVADGKQNLGIQVTLLTSPLWRCVHWDPIAAVFVRATYPLPAGVKPFDFGEGLFTSGSKDSLWVDSCKRMYGAIRPGGSDLREPLRLTFLAQAMMIRPSASKDDVELILWRAIRTSVWQMRDHDAHPKRRGFPFSDYHEQRRSLACALLLWDRLNSAGREEADLPTPVMWLGGIGRHWARQVLEAAKGDMTTSLLLAESLVDAGAIDESIDVLRGIRYRPSAGRMGNSLKEGIESSIAEKQRQLGTRRIENLKFELTVESYQAFQRAGRAGEFAQSTASKGQSIEKWSSDKRRELSKRLWRANAEVAAGCQGASLGTNPDRISEISLDVDETLDERAKAVRLLLNLTFALIAEDEAGIRRAMAEVPLDDLSPADAQWLQHVRDLLLHEANPR